MSHVDRECIINLYINWLLVGKAVERKSRCFVAKYICLTLDTFWHICRRVRMYVGI